MEGRRYKLWRSGNKDELGSVGVMVKEEPCEKVRLCDRVMVVKFLFHEDVLRLI